MPEANSECSEAVLNIDLHCHSSASDGSFSPSQLLQHAHECGVDVLALTDHDTVAGLAEAKIKADELGIQFVNGVEISCQWNTTALHVVALGIDLNNADLLESLKNTEAMRQSRGKRIGEKLEAVGIKNAYSGALAIAKGGTVTRGHFSQFLIEQGHAKNNAQVFKRFMVRNKPGYVKGEWPSLANTLEVIRQADGVAVLAHPARYRLSNTKLNALLIDFKEGGGEAIEVVSGCHNITEMQLMTGMCLMHELAASRGSDFHGPEKTWIKLGAVPNLIPTLTPVWEKRPDCFPESCR